MPGGIEPIGPQPERATVRRRSGGFTVIEMLCVVVIMAIAAALVYAQMAGQGYVQAESAARNIVSDLLLAQNTAIATQLPVYVSFNTGSAASNGISSDSYALCSTLSPNALFLTNPLSQQSYVNSWQNANWTISSVNCGGQSYMDFNSLGEPETTPGTPITANATVVITSAGYNFVVTILPYTGDITVDSSGGP